MYKLFMDRIQLIANRGWSLDFAEAMVSDLNESQKAVFFDMFWSEFSRA